MAPATVEPPTVASATKLTFPPKHPEEIREKAKLLFIQGLKPSVIAEELGLKYQTVNTWITRYNWNRTVAQAKRVVENRAARVLTIVNPVQNALQSSGNRLRAGVSGVLAAQLAVLQENPGKTVSELRNTPDGEGLVSVTKRLVDSLAVVHDWSAQRNQGVVVFEQSTLQDEPSIDVQASCGVEPTAGSVPPRQSIGDATTSEQPPKPQ